MKKLLLITVFTIASLFFIMESCNKNAEKCIECNESPYIITNGTILSNTFSLKNYESENYSHLNWNINLDNFLNFKEKLKLPDEINYLKTAAIILYTEKLVKNELKLPFEDISGILIYYVEDSKLYTKVLIKNGQNFEILDKFSTSASHIYGDNIIDVGKYAITLKLKSSIVLHTDNKFNFGGKNLDLISNVLNFHKKKGFNLKAQIGEGYRCKPAGCNSSAPGRCVDDGGGGMKYCQPGTGKDCPLIMAGNKITSELSQVELNDLNFTVPNVMTDLYNFRDNYLMNSEKGQYYITAYYFLSDDLFDNSTNYTLENSLYIFNTIKDIVLPKLSILINDPNSQNILINDTDKQSLLTFMDWVKALLSSQDSKNLIDELKQDLINNSNISTANVNAFILN